MSKYTIYAWKAKYGGMDVNEAQAAKQLLRKGNAQKKVKLLADPTIDKIHRIMSLVFKHGQRCNFLPRQQEGNP